MADFVAVIRKAVDGLANNTPEMRAKVYEKARGAVLRQLENMKPRPSDDLLRRQMMKIDAAIAEVESEHAEAIEAEEEDVSYAEAPSYVEEVAPAAQAEEAAVPVYEDAPPAHVEETRDDEVRQDAVVEPEREPEQAYQPASHYEPYNVAQEPAHDTTPEPDKSEAVEQASVLYAEPHVQAYEPARDEEEVYEPVRNVPDNLYEQPERPRYVDDGRPAAEDEWQRVVDDAAEPPKGEAAWTGNIDDNHSITAAHYGVPDPVSAESERTGGNWRDMPDATAFPRYEEPTEEPRPVHDDSYEPVAETPQATRQDAEQQSASSFYDEIPAVDDERDHVAPAAKAGTVQPGHFEEVAWEGFDNAPVKDNASTGKIEQNERSPWEDLEELIGYDGGKDNVRPAGEEKAATSGIFDDVAPVSYVPVKKKKRNYAAPVLAILGVALVAGGGYALWSNRDAMNDVFGGLIEAAKPGGTETASAPPAAQPPAANGAPAGTQAPPVVNNGSAIPGDDGAIKGTKFTQRLTVDGREVDEGEAGASATTAGEGQSVAQQNEAPPAGTATPPAGTATSPSTQSPPVQTALPAGAERVFLYEERLGQTVPTTLEGSVAWSLQEEAGANGAPEKVVQGRIEVPGRGLSAMVTFRRNTDSSLPASHIFEIVFSVGAGFDGGAIESVQRIALKQTEQDRGNALVAVPARITDDFHMIALNDFPDARASNLELLRTRNWIDIPVTYRNGRRALLTMPKGPEGIKAFDEALASWAALPATSQ